MLWSIVALEAVSFTALLTLGALWAGASRQASAAALWSP